MTSHQLPPPSSPGSDTSRRRSGGARVFADAAGALWSAALTVASVGWAMVFTCVTDARQPVRALALAEVPHAAELTEGVLREWLTRAPRLGPLP